MNYTTEEKIEEGNITIKSFLPEIGLETVRQEILNGLRADQKRISSKFFYDEMGSKLFEEITELPEYYPSRTEKSILRDLAGNLSEGLEETDIVELGSGDLSKIKILFDEISEEARTRLTYIPVDVSYSAIQDSAQSLVRIFPSLSINGMVADFTTQLERVPVGRRRLFCFFGSTIGNLTRSDSYEFMRNLGEVMKSGDRLLMGVDLIKDLSIIERAYNDSQGITARFNKNILNVVNSLVGSDFDPGMFHHRAFFNSDHSRVEMHLVAAGSVETTLSGGDSSVNLREGESIHTENSHKYSYEDLERFASAARLKIKEIHTDESEWFALVEMEKV